MTRRDFCKWLLGFTLLPALTKKDEKTCWDCLHLQFMQTGDGPVFLCGNPFVYQAVIGYLPDQPVWCPGKEVDHVVD